MTGERHDIDPPHDMCLGDDPCVCEQLLAAEERGMLRALGMESRP